MELFPLYPLNLCKWFPFLAQLIFEINALCYVFMAQDSYSLIFCCRYLFTFYFSCFSFIMFLPPTTKTRSFLYVLGSRFTFTSLYIHFLCFCNILYHYQTKSPNFVSQILPLHTNITFFIMDAATIWIKPLLSHSVLLFRIYLRCSAVMLSVHSMNSYLSLFKYNSLCVAWGRRNWVWMVHAQFSPTDSKI